MRIQSPTTDAGRNLRDIAFLSFGTILSLISENIEMFSFLGENTEIFGMIISGALIIVNRMTRNARG